MSRPDGGRARHEARRGGRARSRAALVRLLEDRTLRANAQRLHEEVLAMPTPDELVRTLEELVLTHRAGAAPTPR